jgi:UDP-glucuronate 4-epimerase
MKILVTGGAGFIGSHLSKRLVEAGHQVVIVDDFSDIVYEPALKELRLEHLFSPEQRPTVVVGSIMDPAWLDSVFAQEKFDVVFHLAAHPNTDKSWQHPALYAAVNEIGTINVLDAASRHGIKQFILAGSSSVYNDEQTPFQEDAALAPRSPYGASKAAAEMHARTWRSKYPMKMSITRFFSVYGPWGRPDMAYLIFAKGILEGKAIQVTAEDRQRDYTYIDDIVDGLLLALEHPFDFEIINLGRGNPVSLNYFVETLEKTIGKKANKKQRTSPPGEMRITYADTTKAQKLLGYQPKVSVEEGIKRLVDWVKEWHSKI